MWLGVGTGVGNGLMMDLDDIGGRSGQAKRWVTKFAHRRAWALSRLAVVIVAIVAGHSERRARLRQKLKCCDL